jgi:hypothetical protein
VCISVREMNLAFLISLNQSLEAVPPRYLLHLELLFGLQITHFKQLLQESGAYTSIMERLRNVHTASGIEG